MSNNARNLREQLSAQEVVRLMGAHNALGACVAEDAGFDGIWASGLEISTSHAVPDANILTMSEFLAASTSMVDAVKIPIVADCDTGFGNSNNAMHMARRFEAAGVAAVCIEDKMFPKVNSFVPGRQELAPLAEFVGKIMAAKSAQRSEEFMVIARIEALIAGWGLDEALRRAAAYEQAGADALLIHSKAPTVGPVREFLDSYVTEIPIIVVPTTYPETTADEFGRMGASMVVYANHGMRAAIRAMEETYTEVLTTGSTVSIEGRIAPLERVFDIQGMPQMKADELAFLRTEDESVSAVILAAGAHESDPSFKEIMSDVPISMLDIVGKPLLQRQVEVLNQVGIQDVTVVTGYRGDEVDVDGVRSIQNDDWASTGELRSLLLGVGEETDRTLVIYGDVLFDQSALKRLLKADVDTLLLLDRSWALRSPVEQKKLDLVSVAEPSGEQRRYLASEGVNSIVRIGRDLDPDEANCEFTGLAIFSRQGLEIVKQIGKKLEECADGEGFHDSPDVARASLTDVLQEAIDLNESVGAVEVSSGWLEIHTFDDYQLAGRLVRN